MPTALAMATDLWSRCDIDVGDGIVPVWVAGNGPPLLLLHGWTLDHRMWQPQIETLGARYRLIMPDRRGFGRSTAPPDLTREAGDVLKIADALDLHRFGLAGLSQGAAVALEVAIRNPVRVQAVALAGTPLPGIVTDTDADPVRWNEYSAMVRDGSIAMFRRTWLAHPLMQVGTEAGRILLARIVANYDGRDLLQPSMLEIFTRDAIAALPMPLLAIAGSDESGWRIDCAHLLAEAAPHGMFVSIADAGHIANVAQPAAFDAAMIDFLEAHLSFPA